jgi:hypothetical protein
MNYTIWTWSLYFVAHTQWSRSFGEHHSPMSASCWPESLYCTNVWCNHLQQSFNVALIHASSRTTFCHVKLVAQCHAFCLQVLPILHSWEQMEFSWLGADFDLHEHIPPWGSAGKRIHNYCRFLPNNWEH